MNDLMFDNCSNCGACYNICPFSAISIDKTEIFYTLIVDDEKCIKCGLCASVCPVQLPKQNISPLVAYGAWCKDKNIVMQSSSGGVFYGLAEQILRDGGIIYGAIFDEDYKEVVFRSTEEVPLETLMKSKYIESLTGNSFKSIKEKLQDGRKILFCGTPCQVHGLKRYLKRDFDNLLCCDFSCGGLPSHKIYQKYIENLEKKYNSRVASVDFRPKTHGWNRYAILIKFENGKKYNHLGIIDDYYRAFLYGKYSVRDYCVNCDFAENHVADITLADFWKYRSISTLNNDNGISLVLCNTEKGCDYFKGIMENYVIEEIELKKASYNLCKQSKNVQQEMKRNQFLKDFEKIGLHESVNKHIRLSFVKKVKIFFSEVVHRRKTWSKKK